MCYAYRRRCARRARSPTARESLLQIASKITRCRSVITFALTILTCIPAIARQPANDAETKSPHWNAAAAAGYLDRRAAWWESWPSAKRDHDTVCVSCHTMVPYALSRPKLRVRLGESSTPEPERQMLQYLQKRVELWDQVQPYYLDAKSGPGKSRESRATESVLNAFLLASYDSGERQLRPVTRKAFASAWALQLKSGKNEGAWDWQVFHLSPWEGVESQYQSAAFMALAVGWAPGGYRKEPGIKNNLQALRTFLRRDYAAQPLLNRIMVLWASAKLPWLLSSGEKRALITQIDKHKRKDGGWSLPDLGSWQRSDHTAQSTDSDGYATGLITLALEGVGMKSGKTAVAQGRAWLESHQSQDEGSWSAVSLNKKRDPTANVGRFMSDAATGYAVLALTAGKR